MSLSTVGVVREPPYATGWRLRPSEPPYKITVAATFSGQRMLYCHEYLWQSTEWQAEAHGALVYHTGGARAAGAAPDHVGIHLAHTASGRALALLGQPADPQPGAAGVGAGAVRRAAGAAGAQPDHGVPARRLGLG